MVRANRWAVLCHSEANGAYGYDMGGSSYQFNLLWQCSDYNNTSGRHDTMGGADYDLHEINCTAAAMTDPANDDYSLNSTAGGGVLLQDVVTVPWGHDDIEVGAVCYVDAGGVSTNFLFHGGTF